MLPVKNRLNLKNFKKRFSRKKIVSGDFLIIANQKVGVFKVGVSVSKKVAPKAVDRNRSRRLILEALRDQDIFEGELAIFAKKNLANQKTEEVKEKLLKLIGKIEPVPKPFRHSHESESLGSQSS